MVCSILCLSISRTGLAENSVLKICRPWAVAGSIGGLLPCFALTMALLLPSQHALAWGEEGHRMVGDIAGNHLTPAASRRVAVLLRNDRLADGEPSGRTTLGDIAFWADEIKDHPWGKRVGSWHYDDVPVCGTVGYAQYCKSGNCASAQFDRHVEILGNPRTTLRQKNEALKWIVHLAGDIHQPLHAANRHDRGGNLVQVSFFGLRDNPPYGTINLHTIWDIHMVRRLIADRGGERAIVSLPFSEAKKAALAGGATSDWIEESHQLAKKVVYSVIPGTLSCGGKVRDVLGVDNAYYALAAPVVESQIRKAGLRLARILNETLGGEAVR